MSDVSTGRTSMGAGAEKASTARKAAASPATAMCTAMRAPGFRPSSASLRANTSCAQPSLGES